MLTKTQGWKLRKRWREANTVFFKLPARSLLEPFMQKEPYLVKSALDIHKFVCKKHSGSWDLRSVAVRWEVPHLRKYHLFINVLPATNLLKRQWDSQSDKESEEAEKRKPWCIVGWKVNFFRHVVKWWRFFKTLHIGLPCDPAIMHLGIYPKDKKSLSWKDICIHMCTVTLKIWSKDLSLHPLWLLGSSPSMSILVIVISAPHLAQTLGLCSFCRSLLTSLSL